MTHAAVMMFLKCTTAVKKFVHTYVVFFFTIYIVKYLHSIYIVEYGSNNSIYFLAIVASLLIIFFTECIFL